MSTPDWRADDLFEPGGSLRAGLFSSSAATALREAIRFTRATRWESVRSPHVLMGLLAQPDRGIADWGRRVGTDLPELLAQFQSFFHQEEGTDDAALALHREFLSDNVLRLLRQAQQRAGEHARRAVTSFDLLISLLTASNSIVAHCFEVLGGLTAARLTELAVLAEQHTEGAEPTA